MRIATSQLHSQSIRAITDTQVKMARTQNQLSTGRRIQSPSDDPVGSARLLELRQQIAVTDRFQENITLARGRLSVQEQALKGAGDVIHRVRELTIQANNGALKDEDRHIIAQEVRELSNQLLELANTRDDDGDFLFAGYKTRTQPFVTVAGSVVYQGDQGQQFLQIEPTRHIAVGDSGAEVFQRIRNGNGAFKVGADAANTGSGTIAVGSVVDQAAFQSHSYRIEFTAADTFDVIDDTMGTTVLSGQTYVAGEAISFDGIETAIDGEPLAGDRFTVEPATQQDIFTTLDNLATALETGATTMAEQAQFEQALTIGLAELDQGFEHLIEIRTQVGTRLNALDRQDEANQDFTLRMQEIATDIDGLDYAEAASRLSQQLLTLEAAQQTYVRVQNLSLFKFLG